MMTLQRRAGVALWRQIAETLEKDIREQVYEPGQRLPPEAELAERFSVNRHTVHRGIAFPAQEGVLRVEQGRGTLVLERIDLKSIQMGKSGLVRVAFGCRRI